MADIGVVGGGYVGTVLAACLASLGENVVLVEIDPERLHSLRTGTPHFYEKDLPELLASGIESGNLAVTDDMSRAGKSDIVFLCIGTPPRGDGHPDMHSLTTAVEALGQTLRGSTVLVVKSTVPIGSGPSLLKTVVTALESTDRNATVSIVSNPEFLREGTAVNDFLHPARIVLGSTAEDAISAVRSIYQPIIDQSFDGGKPEDRPQVITTDHATAEMVKYAANAFLAGRISFINEMSNICESVDADILTVSKALGLDPRIGPHFLAAGAGWGGSCFGKDLQSLMATARDHGLEAPMLQAIADVNEGQRDGIVGKLHEHLGTLQERRIAMLGVSFKPGTDDTRDSPAIAVAARLIDAGAEVVAYDPMVKQATELPDLAMADDPYSTARECDALLLMTDWPMFKHLDMPALAASMAGKLLVDSRNMLNPVDVADAGLYYIGMGRHSAQ